LRRRLIEQKGERMMPLEGIKVIDLSRYLPGPYCTMILADMGADVVKVEEIKSRWSPLSLWPESRREIRDELFRPVDRNKRRIALDLKSEKGKEVYLKLAETVDVIVEEFRPGVTKRLGIDYEVIKEINPSIVYCSITAFGQDGPYRDLPAHDPDIQAMAGLVSLTTSARKEYVIPGVPIADLNAGNNAAMGILLALFAREKTGEGQFIDISMLDAAVSWAGVARGDIYFATGREFQPGERLHHIYQTRDGKHICIWGAVAEPWFWERLCRCLSIEEYIPYKNELMLFAPSSPQKRNEIISRLADIFRTKTRDEWLDILRAKDICVAPVNTLEEAFSDSQVVHRQMVIDVESPEGGKVRQIGIMPKLSSTPGKIRSLTSARGEHTRNVLLELGYTDKEVDDLRKAGIIYQSKKQIEGDE